MYIHLTTTEKYHEITRKIYQRLLDWKKQQLGRTALLIEGARRIGKSYVVEAFARQEYDDYLLVDFSAAQPEVQAVCTAKQ